MNIQQTALTLSWFRQCCAITVALLLAGTTGGCGHRAAPGASAVVRRASFEIWTLYDGHIEARSRHPVASRLAGSATLVELAPDGAHVRVGEIVARFDAAPWEREVVRLARDATLAREDLRALENGRLPLELGELEARVAEARRKADEEQAAQADDLTLQRDGLLAPQDVAAQIRRSQAAATAARAAADQLERTRKHLHPAALARARATSDAAEQELATATAQVSNCVVYATADGIVALLPLPLGTDVRPARVGDTLFRNQPFLTIPDLREPLAVCAVPESDLHRVPPGVVAVVELRAWPDLVLTGRVESAAATAQPAPGSSTRLYPLTIRLEAGDARLRADLTARVRIRTYARVNATLVPRAAVWWENDRAICRTLDAQDRMKIVPVIVGPGNERDFEVIQGLVPGQRVLMP
ncbi:MAG: hypothetical protein WCL16_08115 [bacterium]